MRKIPLVTHVDSVGLVTLRKRCRLSVVCEMLIVHQAQIERLIHGVRYRQAARREYLVLGTLESRTWRRGFCGGVTVEELVDHMADFKAYMRIDDTPGGWYRPSETAG